VLSAKAARRAGTEPVVHASPVSAEYGVYSSPGPLSKTRQLLYSEFRRTSSALPRLIALFCPPSAPTEPRIKRKTFTALFKHLASSCTSRAPPLHPHSPNRPRPGSPIKQHQIPHGLFLASQDIEHVLSRYSTDDGAGRGELEGGGLGYPAGSTRGKDGVSESGEGEGRDGVT